MHGPGQSWIRLWCCAGMPSSPGCGDCDATGAELGFDLCETVLGVSGTEGRELVQVCCEIRLLHGCRGIAFGHNYDKLQGHKCSLHALSIVD